MPQLSKELVKKLKDDSNFQIFQEYIIEVVNSLESLSGYDTEKDNQQLGEELRARVIARDKLYEILRPFVTFNEKKMPSVKEVQKIKKRFGL